MIPRLLMLSILVCFAGVDADALHNVSLDQVGYPTQSAKYVFVSSVADSFQIVDAVTHSVRFTGSLAIWRSDDPATGNTVRRGDFSAFQPDGEFFIVTSAGDSSYRFVISDTVYNQAYRKSLKGFFFQRCGTSLPIEFAGPYQHPVCHTQDGVFHSSTDSSGVFRACAGGWHDAGDYGKYVVNAGVTVGSLLMAYEYFPSKFSQDDLGIPESANGVPDILDEVRYELQWLLKMQHVDGGVYFKLTRQQFEGFTMPQNDNGTRYLYQTSSTATGDFAALMARAARMYAAFDTTFAQRCRIAAVNAWSFLVAHPSIVPSGGFRNPPGTATGEYGDGNDSDERLWAAAELFVSTGDPEYNTYYQSNYSSGVFSGIGWPNVRSLGHLTYLKSQQTGTNETVRLQLRNELNSYCAAQVTRRNSSGYQVVLLPGDYSWGCNSTALNAALLLIMGYTEFTTQSFLDVAADQLHYIFGANAHSLCFMTGAGTRSPRQPHHRPSASDGIADPVPGLLTGGPDQYRSDPVLQAIFTSSTPPALCYVDTLPSYASNEIAINWNAPLVFVLGYFVGSGSTSLEGSRGAMHPPHIRLDQNFPNPFNPSTVIPFGLPSRAFVSLKVFDVIGREVSTIVSEELTSGSYARQWNAVGFPSGVYFCRLQAGMFTETKKLLLLR
jgi:endoglucanase